VGLAYSLVNIPYGSMAPAMTQVPEERARLAAFRSMGSGATVLMLAWVVAPQIKRYVGNPAGFQQSLTFTTGIFVIVGFLLFLFTFLTCKEQVQRDVASVSLKQSMATLKTNMPLMMLCGTALLAITGTTAFSTVGAYYARDVLSNANLFIWITLVNTGVIFLLAPLMPTMVHTIGKRNAYLIGGMLGIIGGVGMAFAPGLVMALIGAGIMGVGIATTTRSCGRWRLTQSSTASGRRACARKGRPTRCFPSPASWARPSAVPRPRSPSVWVAIFP
jgi:glucuronide carrier protein